MQTNHARIVIKTGRRWALGAKKLQETGEDRDLKQCDVEQCHAP